MHLKTFPHNQHVSRPRLGAVTTPNWQKTGNDEVVTKNRQWCNDPKTIKRVSTAKKTIWTMISVTSGRVRPIPTQWYLKYSSSTLKCVQACPFTKPNVWFLPPPFALTMTNYELLRKDWATRAPVAQTLQSVRQTSPRTTTTCAYLLVQVSSSGNCKSKPVLTIFSIQLIGF